ncbi:SGNH/GDSL hydrolase family protein [Spirosoma utsteinense]|uniref:SGNH hydrolase-type esterase domain-containing protein n=1 Tax=Spirosoma utsteinense TaxID=2585773 RepID=A0ABR6W573_9BACT|nr:hypothetical protein [Spirosoma utsteinense]MBC3785555.1 hypothetical protein [Spirosoma utsteinense]MBC3791703.1 hypothetical protein [Spirosoma utsteinense]
MPQASALENYQASLWADGSRLVKASPDPIRFLIQSDKRQVVLNEEVNLTITAQLLNITPNQLFYVPGSNAYTLKMILPPGFEQTGGDFTDYVVGNLSYATQPVLTYHIKGYFRSVTAGTSFRLLRSHGQANDQSLFAEKSAVTLETLAPGKTLSQQQKATAASSNPTDLTLYVVTSATDMGAARAAAAAYQGFLDYAACDAVSGWIVNTSDLSKSQEVDIYINGVKAATVMADQHRRDVAAAFGANDFNEYGYVWVIPDYYKSNTVLSISVRPADSSTDLSMSPQRTDVCPGTGKPPVTTPPATTTTVPPSTSTTAPSTPPTTTPPAPVTVTPPVTTTTGGALTMLAPTYNCTSGAITFNTSGGDGTTIRYRATGITGWTTDPNQYLDQGSRVNADTPPFTIYVEQSGKTITYTWSRQATCDGTAPAPTPPTTTPPAPVTVTPPVTTTTSGALTMLAPTYNCTSGAITFNTSGGDGTTIRYRATGITGWTTDPNQYLDQGSRVNADTPPFTIYVEQSGKTITYTWSRQATCDGTPPVPTPPTTTPPAPVTVTPPATGNGCAASISTISYLWDGGNNSISIQINASAGTPQIRLSGPTTVDWTNTNKIQNDIRFWALSNMNTGTYTLSVRQSGDQGNGCSFSFSVPSTGKQLYPVTDEGSGPVSGCTPPPAPTVSAEGETQVCNNSTVTLTAAGCTGTVLWSGGQSGSSISVNAAGTYTATCTVNGCVSAPSSQLTVTACPVSSGKKYERVLYVGNSITLHGGSPFFIVNDKNPKRGMAATSPDKDYVHLMSAKHQSLNPSVENRTLASWNMGGQLDEATGPYWEGQSTKNGIDLSRFDPVAAWKPDIIYIRLGENVTDWEINNPAQYQNRLKDLIDKLISQSPGAKVVLSTAVWDKPNYDAAIRAIGAERNYPIADFSNMWPNRLINGYYALNPSIYGDAGTDNHPDDDGMAHMADGLWNATPK